MPSFDIVSNVDLQEVDNAVNQALKEMSTRYDFKDSKSELRWDKKGEITISGESDGRLKSILEILQGRIAKRGIPLKSLEYGKVEDAAGGMKRQVIKILQGIPVEKAKEIVKAIKATGLKVQPQIQEEQVRVTGKKIDDLQAVISELKAKDMGVPLQFVNMRP